MLETTAQRNPRTVARIGNTLQMLEQRLPLTRRVVHDGDIVYRAGDSLDCLFVIHAGFFKAVNLAGDGRQKGLAR